MIAWFGSHGATWRTPPGRKPIGTDPPEIAFADEDERDGRQSGDWQTDNRLKRRDEQHEGERSEEPDADQRGAGAGESLEGRRIDRAAAVNAAVIACC
jgi:hypothetical protein